MNKSFDTYISMNSDDNDAFKIIRFILSWPWLGYTTEILRYKKNKSLIAASHLRILCCSVVAYSEIHTSQKSCLVCCDVNSIKAHAMYMLLLFLSVHIIGAGKNQAFQSNGI